MGFFLTTSQALESRKVFRTKEEFLAELSKMIDSGTANGSTYFDIVMDTDVEV